jgi:hypothetical protein
VLGSTTRVFSQPLMMLARVARASTRKSQPFVASSVGIQRIIVGMSEDKPPVFFIPGCQPEEQEELYAAMARSCNVHVPGPGQRLHLISHRHDGDVWFATAGKTLGTSAIPGSPNCDLAHVR